ncbi:MAG: RsmE family RNA methyltransferase [Anaerovoracaceae bacterium]
MRKFFADPSAVGERTILLEGEDARHISKVLRLQKGDKIEISDMQEWEYICEITTISRNSVGARILDKQGFSREPETRITLFQGVPKGQKLEEVVRRSTELGVAEIVPVFMIRSVVRDNGTYGRKIIRANAVAAEASKQCRRDRIPIVSEAVHSDDLPPLLEDFDLVLFPYENEREVTIRDVLHNLDRKPKKVAILIGPEGGFSDEEARHFTFSGAISVSLGRTILRTETAGPAAIAMCLYELEL